MSTRILAALHPISILYDLRIPIVDIVYFQDEIAGVMALAWLIVQHFLFGLIGAAVNIGDIQPNTAGTLSHCSSSILLPVGGPKVHHHAHL